MPTITRRNFLGLVGAGAAAAAIACSPRRLPAADATAAAPAPQAAAPARRPNVLMLYTDDQRYDSIGALGTPVVQTPNIDALMARGTVFTNPYIMGGTQGAICVCSRACLMTGRTLWHAPGDLPADLPLWPEVFRKAGYTTFAAGKWHNGRPSHARCFSAGGAIFFGGMSDHLQVPVHDFDPTGKYAKADAHVGKAFSSELFSDTAIRFLKDYKEERPFFLYLAYTAPHDPRMAPEKYARMYPPEKVPLPPNFLPEHPFDNGIRTIRDEVLAPYPRTAEDTRRQIGAYYAMITHLDEQIGRVLAALKEAGHDQDTIVVFGGDNGLAVGQHGLFGKQNCYEHSLRVPLAIAGPGIAAGERRDAFVYHLDIFPTVCDLAGVPAPATVEGKSLAGVLRDKSATVRDSIYAGYTGLMRSVRDERFKLIRYTVKSERHVQLFDLKNDPWETKNLADDPAMAKQVAALDARMAAWRKQTDDPWKGTA